MAKAGQNMTIYQALHKSGMYGRVARMKPHPHYSRKPTLKPIWSIATILLQRLWNFWPKWKALHLAQIQYITSTVEHGGGSMLWGCFFWNWNGSSPFSMKPTQSTQSKKVVEWLRNNFKKVNVLEFPQSAPRPKSNPNSFAWLEDCCHFPRNLTELEQFCREEWSNIAKTRCAKFETYPNRLQLLPTGASTKY